MAWQRLGPGRERLETYVLFVSALRERGIETLAHFRSSFPDLLEDDTPLESDPGHRAVADAVFQGYDDTWARFRDPKTGKLTRVTVRKMLQDVMERPGDRTVEYNLLYHHGSEVIHTSPFSLSGLLSRVDAQQQFFLESLHTDSRLVALAIGNVSMLVVLKTADEYIGLDLESELEAIVEANSRLNDTIEKD